MVAKKSGKSGKAQLREEGEPPSNGSLNKASLIQTAGLEKTDNNLPQTSWPIVGMINQKNYYTYESDLGL
jgi:hypothetical protein